MSESSDQPSHPPSEPPRAAPEAGLDQAQQQRVVDFLHGHPSRIGSYHILEGIGQGGMGVVYKAEQREPVRRIVALKLIKLGMDTIDVIARFESERQALAMMNHPNVAKVFDAGTSETGRPYFVMEYVAGESITAFCDRHQFSIRQRLELFTQACEAVQHAHQKAIIHRDLKPSNILVMFQDGKPLVKVIDFGVAKATARRLTERTLFTESGTLLGTPEYMSPEQAEMSALLDVDTRTDVYSLGVVLYELVAGALPFDPTTLRSAGYNEIQRIIREVDPPRPSTRLSALGNAAEVARNRATQQVTLQRQLNGELGLIPLKAMRKERAHRYATAAELAQDIRNYLEQRPLVAGPESRAYRASKFLRRNWRGVAASAGMLFLMVAGIVATTWQAIRATSAERATRAALLEVGRQKTQVEQANATVIAVNTFLMRDVLAAADPAVGRGREITVREAVERASQTIEARFPGQPIVEGAVRQTLAMTYAALGRADLGLPHAEAAVDIARRAAGPEHPDTLRALDTMGLLLQDAGRFIDAEPLHRQAMEGRARLLGANHPETITSLRNLAAVAQQQGRLAEAESLHREAFDRENLAPGMDPDSTLSTMNNLATVLQAQGKYAEAITLYREVHERRRRERGDDHPTVLIVAQNLGMVLFLKGDLDEAEVMLRDVLVAQRRVLGDDHPQTLRTLNTLAGVLQARGRLDEAETLFRELMDRGRRAWGKDHPHTMIVMNNLAKLLRQKGDDASAEPLLREALESLRRTLGDEHPNTLTAMQNVGGLLQAQGKLEEAEALTRQALAGRQRVLGPDHSETLGSAYQLGSLLEASGRASDAEPLLAELYRRCVSAQINPSQAARFMSSWGLCLVKLKRYEQADAPLRDTYRRLTETKQNISPSMARVLRALADVCDQTNRSDEAIRWRTELAALQATTTPATSAAEPSAQ